MAIGQEYMESRKTQTHALLNKIEETVDGVLSVGVDDATPRTWESVALAVYVDGKPQRYYPDAYNEEVGMVITTNLRRFAPQLYNTIREDPHVSTMEVVSKPTRVTSSTIDNLYDGNLYLIDVWYP